MSQATVQLLWLFDSNVCRKISLSLNERLTREQVDAKYSAGSTEKLMS